MTDVELIAQERQRQIEEEGYTPEKDIKYNFNEELAQAASCYALPEVNRFYLCSDDKSEGPVHWPWHRQWWKPTPNDRIRELVKAGALIAAEIDRLQEIEGKEND